ncbi:MarR family winged helix-turn-helix transcriptional regulator [Halomonas faecis]|uniref:MarR family winged helix-turn-helix transcriptional regulator n=1 Tax=Halomonas faecis TaxID=1562110 RepID=UPI0013D77D79|nr:MarR family transcriptional regulator [Halomonas faecis]
MADSDVCSDLQLDHQLCFALYSTSLLMTKFYKPLLTALNLTYPQYLVMMVLWEEDGLSAGTVSQRLYTDTGSLTPVFKRLAREGLLERVRSERDERVVELHLTDAGRALQERAREIPDCVVMASGQSFDELHELKERLETLRGRLKEAMP